ncbi:hypothetical protein Bca52824_082322 [Brassica carinata]|uniref:Uncharacterized protein n=1 Tax=Brassica carinata TaxID=52824 RepID=A0A8X7TU40_BRACI|nr:hypothetical protein Bca52824_082322 [Brassica carinata]
MDQAGQEGLEVDLGDSGGRSPGASAGGSMPEERPGTFQWFIIGPPVNNTQRFKWVPSKKFISMFPSRGGMLNVNAQASLHIIQQRKNGLLSQSFSCSSSSTESKTTTTNYLDENTSKGAADKMLDDDQKKPEMDLNEFLQQMGILKDNSQAEVSQVAECDSTPLWKEQEETGSEASAMHFDSSNLESYGDLEYDLGFPSIWNFCGILDE